MSREKSSVKTWNCTQVGKWLTNGGFERYSDLFAVKHKIDGETLLMLTESDLRQPPLEIPVLAHVKQLWIAIQQLQRGKPSVPCALVQCERSSPVGSTPKLFTDFEKSLIARVESPDTDTKSLVKTLIAFVYCSISLLMTSFVMVIVHDRVPDMETYPPLPDLFLDKLPLIPWAFEMCEKIACCMMAIWCAVLLFHRYKNVLLCRIFALTGTVFLLRCITMLITSLSVPGVHLKCKAKQYTSFNEQIRSALNIWLGMGMSMKGVRSCGDYMFSGHTTVLTLLNHFITEYSPENWRFLHTTTWVLQLFGIFFILAGHEHYSIDVFIGFYISSRLFLYYHSMANGQFQKDARTRIWFPLFWFFESGRYGRIPNEYEWPLPSCQTIKSILFLILNPFCDLDKNGHPGLSDQNYKSSDDDDDELFKTAIRTNTDNSQDFRKASYSDNVDDDNGDIDVDERKDGGKHQRQSNGNENDKDDDMTEPSEQKSNRYSTDKFGANKLLSQSARTLANGPIIRSRHKSLTADDKAGFVENGIHKEGIDKLRKSLTVPTAAAAPVAIADDIYLDRNDSNGEGPSKTDLKHQLNQLAENTLGSESFSDEKNGLKVE